MSFLSDPDRLERFARYVVADPPNVQPREVADALNDAAARIRSLQRVLDAAYPIATNWDRPSERQLQDLEDAVKALDA